MKLSPFLAGLLMLSACQQPVRPPAPPPPDPAAHVPPFARVPFAPFSRVETVSIALREWRLWGERVNDLPPGSRPQPLPDDKPERMAGLWQRVGEYWWLGQNAGRDEAAWTGRHDTDGSVFPAERDEAFAWSAAFISYVMRIGGAGARFPYSPAHATYINQARMVSLGSTAGLAVSAEAPEDVAPGLGDLICYGRHGAARMHFADLPTTSFPGHCDMVVGASAGMLSVVGGNVDDAVTMKHVPTTPDGRIATADGQPVDGRYGWFVVIRVLYDQ